MLFRDGIGRRGGSGKGGHTRGVCGTGSQDGPYHIHPGSQAGYDYLLSEGSVVLRADGQERNFVISRMNAHGKPMLAPSVVQVE